MISDEELRVRAEMLYNQQLASARPDALPNYSVEHESYEVRRLLREPEKFPLPTTICELFDLLRRLAPVITTEHAAAAMVLIRRLPLWAQIVCLQKAIERDRNLMLAEPIKQWIWDSHQRMHEPL